MSAQKGHKKIKGLEHHSYEESLGRDKRRLCRDLLAAFQYVGQVVQSFEQLDLVKVVPVDGRRFRLDDL